MNSLSFPWSNSPSISFNNYKYYLYESKLIPTEIDDALVFKFSYGDGTTREQKFKINNESYFLLIDTNSSFYGEHIYKLKIVDKFSYLSNVYELIASRIQDFLNLTEISYEDFYALENSYRKIEKYLLLI